MVRCIQPERSGSITTLSNDEKKCSKALILKQRFNFKDDYLIESLCHSLGITVKQLEDYEKEYWGNIGKVIMGKPLNEK